MSEFLKQNSSVDLSSEPASPTSHTSLSVLSPSENQNHTEVKSTENVDPVVVNPALFDFWCSDLTVQVVDEAARRLLNLDTKDPFGETALIRAVRHGDASVVRALLNAGANVNAADSNGETALSWAAQMGKAEVLKLLIDHPEVDVDKCDKGGHSALFDAVCCQFSNVECVELLLECGAKPSIEMLHLAFDEARLACLLSHGCQPFDLSTFLHSCIRSKGFVHPDCDIIRFPTITRQLHRQEPTPNDNITVAKKAAVVHFDRSLRHQGFVLKDWIAKAGNADCPNARGVTLLMSACAKSNLHAVKMLVQNGASVSAQDCDGCQAIHHAAQRFHPSTLKAVKIVEIVLDVTNNQAINVRDKRGTTPLMIAFQKGHIEAVNLIIERAKKADVLNEVLQATDNRGFNVLHHAAEHLMAHVIRHVLSTQPQLHRSTFLNSRTTPFGKTDRKDATPLHLAISASLKCSGGLETCITLADFGCSLRERNLDGYTGLELLEKLKCNNELRQWALMQDRAEQGGIANIKYQLHLGTWLLETCSVRSFCGLKSAKHWLETAMRAGNEQAAALLAQRFPAT